MEKTATNKSIFEPSKQTKAQGIKIGDRLTIRFNHDSSGQATGTVKHYFKGLPVLKLDNPNHRKAYPLYRISLSEIIDKAA